MNREEIEDEMQRLIRMRDAEFVDQNKKSSLSRDYSYADSLTAQIRKLHDLLYSQTNCLGSSVGRAQD